MNIIDVEKNVSSAREHRFVPITYERADVQNVGAQKSAFMEIINSVALHAMGPMYVNTINFKVNAPNALVKTYASTENEKPSAKNVMVVMYASTKSKNINASSVHPPVLANTARPSLSPDGSPIVSVAIAYCTPMMSFPENTN